jgi:site-specific DNA recombinase
LCDSLAEPAPPAAAVARAHGGAWPMAGRAWLPQELLARRETLRRARARPSRPIERLTDAHPRAVFPLDESERRRRDLDQRVQAPAGRAELPRNDAERQQQLAGLAASPEAFSARGCGTGWPRRPSSSAGAACRCWSTA